MFAIGSGIHDLSFMRLYTGSRLLKFLPPDPKDGEGTVFTGVCLSTGWGYPGQGHPPGQDRTGVPPPPVLGLGYSPPPTLAGSGVPPPHSLPRRQNNRASTCYTAGGMPLAVMQENFLVSIEVNNFGPKKDRCNRVLVLSSLQTGPIVIKMGLVGSHQVNFPNQSYVLRFILISVLYTSCTLF